MADESEKRIHSIMDKLFQSPTSLHSSSSGGNLKRGQKRLSSESALALVEPKIRRDVVEGNRHSINLTEASCRPWDRADLMRRLATFKSMTWFAKPKVVSAVNCARRGWINIDMDIIACETCRARLLFSTPSAWTQQQVEKAALVFSLKLDSGHKSSCSWINNACDERLAEFPPTPSPVLVDKFNDSSSALSQLLALPIISSSAIEYMKSPQLEEFLRQSPTTGHCNKSISLSQIEPVGNDGEANSQNFYYQAQKLISLCGWEPRSLPYIVECKEMSRQLAINTNIISTAHTVCHSPSANGPSFSADTSSEADEDTRAGSKVDIDPNSAVLDCKLCGASVGLWTFSLVPRPVEFFRVVGYSEVNCKQNSGQELCNENHAENREAAANSASNGKLTFADSPSNLNLTIAGGPLPTKQDFKATIAVPVIGQNLRARFSCDSEFRDRIFYGQEGTESGHRNTDQSLRERISPECNSGQQASQPEAKILSSSLSANSDEASGLQPQNGEKGGTLGAENNIDFLLEGQDVGGQAAEVHLHNSHTVQGDPSGKPVGIPESMEGSSGNSQVGPSSVSDTAGNWKSTETDPLLMISFDNLDQEQIQELDVSLDRDNSDNMDRREGETCTDHQSLSARKGEEDIKDKAQIPVNSEMMASGRGKDQKQLPENKLMEFNPIRQHRHYCPWILPTASGPPGWQQTLSALRQMQQSSPSKSPSTPSIIMVNDPLGSVRKLFMSPSAKRAKQSQRAGQS